MSAAGRTRHTGTASGIAGTAAIGRTGRSERGPGEPMIPMPPRGLYAITAATDTDPHRLAARVGAAIDGGAVMIQYRAKDRAPEDRHTAAALLLDVCRVRRIPLIVNDDPALAAGIGADGVHIGRGDGDVLSARRIIGDRGIVGVSCYDRVDLALAAAGEGATYVAFGSFFASPTKPHAVPAPLRLLSAAREKLDVPIVAIGGVTARNGAALIEAGADFIAAVDGVFGADDVERAARGYAALFS